MTRLMIYLCEEEIEALQNMAKNEIRGLKDQVRLILRKELDRQRLLRKDKSSDLSMKEQELLG